MNEELLIDWDRKNNPKVKTFGKGKQYIEVPKNEQFGGHRDTILRCCIVDDWQPVLTALETDLIPAYAYDRVMVSGISVILSR